MIAAEIQTIRLFKDEQGESWAVVEYATPEDPQRRVSPAFRTNLNLNVFWEEVIENYVDWGHYKKIE